MFNIIRFIIGCVFLGCSITLIKKSKVIRKRILYIVFAGISVALMVVLAFLPFENLFMNFNSPKAAYEYYKLGKSNIELVVEGNECDFVIDHQKDSDTCLIIPKTEEGWKIGLGSDTKRIVQKFSDGVSVYVFQYKNTSDYFITVFDTNGGEAIVSDDYNSKFYSLERDNDFLGKTFVTYYAHIPNFNSQYSITVNGNKIVLEEIQQVASSESTTEYITTKVISTEIEENITEECEDVLRYEVQTITLEDIPADAILCENIFADVEDGCNKEEICSRYRDIIAECEKVLENPECNIMLLNSGDERDPWFAFQTGENIENYTLETLENNWNTEYTGQVVPVTILQREEEKDGIRCKVTEVYSWGGVTWWQHQAWIRVCESPQEKGVSQILTGTSSYWEDLDRESSLDIWDVNDDGFLDIAYDGGATSGSGGTWDQYCVFVWNEEGECYEAYDFPLVNRIDKENHKLYQAYQLGAPEQYYVIYGLRDGQYESYKELCLHYEYDAVCDEEGNYTLLDRAIYSEWGEEVEVTDITGLDWDETKELLEGKYPEFTFWREG